MVKKFNTAEYDASRSLFGVDLLTQVDPGEAERIENEQRARLILTPDERRRLAESYTALERKAHEVAIIAQQAEMLRVGHELLCLSILKNRDLSAYSGWYVECGDGDATIARTPVGHSESGE